MNAAGRDFLKTHPLYIEISGQDYYQSIKEFLNEFVDAGPARTYTSGQGFWRNQPASWCIVDGDLPGYGIYVFVKDQTALVELKLVFG